MAYFRIFKVYEIALQLFFVFVKNTPLDHTFFSNKH